MVVFKCLAEMGAVHLGVSSASPDTPAGVEPFISGLAQIGQTGSGEARDHPGDFGLDGRTDAGVLQGVAGSLDHVEASVGPTAGK